MTTAARESLWRDRDFVALWSASTISIFGSLITRTALPFAAILMLGAGPLEISALRSAELIGQLLVGLVVGAWVDRLLRRRVIGRVNATVGTFTTLLTLVGAIGGGIIAESFGLRTAFAVGLIGGLAAIAAIWFSPVRGLRGAPGTVLGPALPGDEVPLTE